MAIFTLALATGGAAAGIFGIDRYRRKRTGTSASSSLDFRISTVNKIRIFSMDNALV